VQRVQRFRPATVGDMVQHVLQFGWNYWWTINYDNGDNGDNGHRDGCGGDNDRTGCVGKYLICFSELVC
jgi:hypothetical protein